MAQEQNNVSVAKRARMHIHVCMQRAINNHHLLLDIWLLYNIIQNILKAILIITSTYDGSIDMRAERLGIQ